MNVEIGAEAALFPEKEYILGIFVALCGLQHWAQVGGKGESHTAGAIPATWRTNTLGPQQRNHFGGWAGG
jgi:hypothetical protein